MQFLKESGRGWPTSVLPVPIVPAAALFDLGIGEASWPRADDGYEACRSARSLDAVEWGSVGAGTGASINKLNGHDCVRRGGIGHASVESPLGQVHAIVAVNAVGAVDREMADVAESGAELTEREATTLGVVILDGATSYRGLQQTAIASHDGYARAIRPVHTLFDGDVVFACASGGLIETSSQDDLHLAIAAEKATEAAIYGAVGFKRIQN
jgi:L-aminopeptidase/D-esterase-like protein